MALAKITLQLGKKKIELTQKEFEELKKDMRELDKSHYYYWHNYRPYWDWSNPGPALCGSANTGGSITRDSITLNDSVQATNTAPSFNGSVVSYEN